MAQSISDLFARGRSSNQGERRSARFVGAQGDEPSATDADGQATAELSDTRRAAYRPAETEALRRDVIDAFSAAMLRDGHWHGEDRPQLLLHTIRALEVLEDFDTAFDRIREFERHGGRWDWETGALKRRILRQMEADELLGRSLQKAPDLAGAPNWARAYAGLEEASLRWNAGADAGSVFERCESAVRSLSSQPNLDAFAALWAMQLRCDAGLESSVPQKAFDALEEAIGLPELTVDIRQGLEARRAVWMHVYGRHHEARRLLDELAQRGTLPGDLDDLLVSLCFEAGDHGRAFTVLRSVAGQRCRKREHAVPLVMLHETAAGNPATCRDVLREATQDNDDWTLLRLHEAFLDAAGEDNSRGGATELIDVLNRRLEGPLSVDERVNTLTRLGRLYEVEAGLEEAAAEVYREALSYDARHVPALRALGRLYTRRENWRALAELYEREIATVGPASCGWRRHYQLAELYEYRLERYERALENYLRVLEERPNYLPALKSSARILERLGRWTQLADLFLRMVDAAPSRRQKLYLLDKVAEVAEDRLQNFEVAIGAWKETLELDVDNPRAYTALGRLYARTHRWEDLIALNKAEIKLVDDDEEVAAIWLRNAEIAEQHLENIELAERYYRKTLDVIPDYLPALEALGRIYLRGARWADIVEMTGRELKTAGNDGNKTRQLGALAEILETKLDRRADAIAIYEELWASDDGGSHVFSALVRLYRAEGRWSDLEEILNQRLEQSPAAAEYSALQGELGILAEWRSEQPGDAYRRYLSALQCDPTDIHWLGGIARTWPDAGVTPEEVANELEDLLMHVTDEQSRDRYFTVIARLRERSQGGPEASRAYRAHGGAESLENQIVLRLAMAAAGERDQLAAARSAAPHHRFQPLLAADRTEMSQSALAVLTDEKNPVPEATRDWFAAELSPSAATDVGADGELSADLVDLLDGQDLHCGDEADIDARCRLRLRALQARRYGDHQSYLEWTGQEMETLPASTAAVRNLELARYATRHQLADESVLYRRACEAVFPELSDDEARLDCDDPIQPPSIPADHIERLYEALRETGRWMLLRRCLEAQVGRPDTDRDERLALFEKLAQIIRAELDDYEGARDALLHCWQLSEKPRFLRQIVSLAGEYDQHSDALCFQKKHFEKVSMSADTTAAERVQSGIWLAELLLAESSAERRTAAIDCLEHLSDSYDDDVIGMPTARRMLARAHADAGNGHRAVEIFEDVLHFQVRNDELDDWRRLVEVQRAQLKDPSGAYGRQWHIVRAFPGSRRDLDTLIDLAAEADEIGDCIEQLGALANATADEAHKAQLLARAAEAADEELGHAEEAYHLFERVVELIDDDEQIYYERRRAVCLARMAGREPRALKAFRDLIEQEPFEPANYRGMETLFEQSNALDRLRVTRQTLRMLGCEAGEPKARGKDRPTRSLQAGIVEQNLMPQPLDGGVFEVLRAAMPLVHKVFSDALPQRKALDGRRIKSGRQIPFYDDLQAALLAFGLTKFKLYVGDSGPDHPMVFASGTPVVWINQVLLDDLSAAQRRFVAGYCAALAWSELPALMALDGRQVWHLVEGVVYRQSGNGFSDRVDVASQQMAERVSSPFDLTARRAVVKAVEQCEQDLDDCHCEAWGCHLEGFAARAGLLLSGDLAAAGRALLRLSGWNLPLKEEATQRRLRNEKTVEDLIELAHSDQYLELRYQTGLAGRPSQLGI